MREGNACVWLPLTVVHCGPLVYVTSLLFAEYLKKAQELQAENMYDLK